MPSRALSLSMIEYGSKSDSQSCPYRPNYETTSGGGGGPLTDEPSNRPSLRLRSQCDRQQENDMKHSHSHETERRIREAALDETLSATFPASDAPSTLPNPDDDSVDAVATANEQDSVTPPSSSQT
jgi:hypothetical protein